MEDKNTDWKTMKQSRTVKRLMKLRQTNEKLSGLLLGLASMLHCREASRLEIMEMCNFVEAKDEELANDLDDILQDIWEKYKLSEILDPTEN